MFRLRRHSSRLLFFHEGTQTLKRRVPLIRDSIKVTASFGEPRPLKLPDALATGPSAAHQSGSFKRAQMFRDGLARDFGAFSQAYDR
jgi:hypothetical protein